MRCLICTNNFNHTVLKLHYQYYHSINKHSYFFQELFLPDNAFKRCNECKIEFKNFLFHYEQTGGSRNQQLPLNILRMGPIIYYSINFQQHKNCYDFLMKNYRLFFWFSSWTFCSWWKSQGAGLYWAEKLPKNCSSQVRKY